MESATTPVLEPIQSQQSSWKKIILYVAVAVASGLLSGGAVWYFMNQQSSDNKTTLNSQIDIKNKSIATLQSKVVALEKGSTGSDIVDTATSTTTTANDLESMKTFCLGGTSEINGFAYVYTHSGTFGTCSLSQNYNIVKKINGNWTKLYEGNGTVDEATIDKYQIPQYIYPKQLITLSTERTY